MAEKKQGIWMDMLGGVRFSREAHEVSVRWSFQGRGGNVDYLKLASKVDGLSMRVIGLCEAKADHDAWQKELEAELLKEIAEICERENAEGETPAARAGGTMPEREAPAVRGESSAVVSLPLDGIDASPYQLGYGARGDVAGDPEILELAASVKAHNGVVQPVIVRAKAGGRWELIAGHRRCAACRLVGFDSVSAIVREMDDAQARAALAVENLQRKNLTAMEEALSVDAMLAAAVSAGAEATEEARGAVVERIASALGKSARWVYRRASITRLTDGWKRAANKLGLSAAFLERLARMPGDVQEEAFRRMDVAYALDGALPDGSSGLSRGGDVGALDGELEMCLRKLSSAPWARVAGDPAKCAGCPDRSDAQADLFEDLSDEPRCLNRVCWDKKVDEWVRTMKRKAAEKYGSCIDGQAASAHLYKETADEDYSVPVVMIDGPRRGAVMWAPNKDAAAEQQGGKRAKMSKKDNERLAYVRAVAACVGTAQHPEWCDGRPVPGEALTAFCLGCGCDPWAVISGAYANPIDRSRAILREISNGNAELRDAIWRGCRDKIKRALDAERNDVTPEQCKALHDAASAAADALNIPREQINGYLSEMASK